MALPAGFQAFLEDDAQRFTQRENQRNGRGMMIGAVLAPETHHRRQIKIPALHGRFAVAHGFFHAGSDRDRSHTRRRADGFLRTAEADIDTLRVDVQRHTGERGHRIDNEQRTKFIRYFAKGLEAGYDSGGGFPVADADEFYFASLAGVPNIVGIDGAAERRFDAVNGGPGAGRNDGHPFGARAIDTDDGFVARLERIDHRALDAARSGS